ncbi:ATP-binding protein [soil metagenome]
MARRLERLSVRVRLTLGFAAVMSLVLVIAGLFVYWRAAAELDRSLTVRLRHQVEELATTPAARGSATLEAVAGQRGFVQVLAPDGRVIAASGVTRRPLLSRKELATAGRGALMVDRDYLGFDRDTRLIARPVRRSARSIVVVGARRGDREEALEELFGALLLTGPVALLLVAVAGYALVGSALRPVEAMGLEASAVSADDPGRRLPLPAADDELARLGRRLNDMLARLESALSRERRFTAEASHELRTPLANLRMELEHALARPRPVAELEASLRSAFEETERLGRLADDLLVIAGGDDGRLPVRPERLDVREVLDELARRFRPRALEQGRSLEVVAPSDAVISTDRLRLEQALGNLVDNGLRHGGGAVRLVARQVVGHVELHVVDEGAGMPDDLRGGAFAPFRRAPGARSGVGNGLGLAVVASIASALGGEARIADREGRGVDAWLELPTS